MICDVCEKQIVQRMTFLGPTPKGIIQGMDVIRKFCSLTHLITQETGPGAIRAFAIPNLEECSGFEKNEFN